jgi:hypothetical protein
MAIQSLTISDIAEIERLSGQPLGDLTDPKAMKGTLMQAIVFVTKRREDSNFTFEMAGNLTMEEMNEVIAEDPT